jgi:hypothetical protein
MRNCQIRPHVNKNAHPPYTCYKREPCGGSLVARKRSSTAYSARWCRSSTAFASCKLAATAPALSRRRCLTQGCQGPTRAKTVGCKEFCGRSGADILFVPLHGRRSWPAKKMLRLGQNDHSAYRPCDRSATVCRSCEHSTQTPSGFLHQNSPTS